MPSKGIVIYPISLSCVDQESDSFLGERIPGNGNNLLMVLVLMFLVAEGGFNAIDVRKMYYCGTSCPFILKVLAIEAIVSFWSGTYSQSISIVSNKL